MFFLTDTLTLANFSINLANSFILISGTDGSSYKKISDIPKQLCVVLLLIYLLSSFILEAVTSAAFLPESNIEP